MCSKALWTIDKHYGRCGCCLCFKNCPCCEYAIHNKGCDICSKIGKNKLLNNSYFRSVLPLEINEMVVAYVTPNVEWEHNKKHIINNDSYKGNLYNGTAKILSFPIPLR